MLEIIELAKQSDLMADGEMWFSPTYGNADVHIADLERFAKLVAAKEREACAKREWVGLTEEEVDEIYTSVQEEVNKHWDKGGTTMMFPFTLYKAIEQALKEKNNV